MLTNETSANIKIILSSLVVAKFSVGNFTPVGRCVTVNLKYAVLCSQQFTLLRFEKCVFDVAS